MKLVGQLLENHFLPWKPPKLTMYTGNWHSEAVRLTGSLTEPGTDWVVGGYWGIGNLASQQWYKKQEEIGEMRG